MHKRHLLFSLILLISSADALVITDDTAHEIGVKIWQNECKCSVDGLTSWNKGEEFASLGIGHFIWYPEGKRGPFVEMFPALLAYLQDKGVAIPYWLKLAKGCPWASKEDFDKDKKSPRMEDLKKLLVNTTNLQAEFVAMRLDRALTDVKDQLSSAKKKRINYQVENLSKSPAGVYAIVDYFNFKGSGLAESERYNGDGWGLKQVLLLMPFPNSNPLEEFRNAAKILLTKRVQNAPPERKEDRWLKGWLERIESYQ